MMSAPHKPLSALLSQILVAYSVEVDCEFQRSMLQTQSRSARLSLVIWLNVLQFLADGPVSVQTLASRALIAEAGATAGLGGLERWCVVQDQMPSARQNRWLQPFSTRPTPTATCPLPSNTISRSTGPFSPPKFPENGMGMAEGFEEGEERDFPGGQRGIEGR